MEVVVMYSRCRLGRSLVTRCTSTITLSQSPRVAASALGRRDRTLRTICSAEVIWWWLSPCRWPWWYQIARRGNLLPISCERASDSVTSPLTGQARGRPHVRFLVFGHALLCHSLTCVNNAAVISTTVLGARSPTALPESTFFCLGFSLDKLTAHNSRCSPYHRVKKTVFFTLWRCVVVLYSDRSVFDTSPKPAATLIFRT